MASLKYESRGGQARGSQENTTTGKLYIIAGALRKCASCALPLRHQHQGSLCARCGAWYEAGHHNGVAAALLRQFQ